MAGAEGWCEQGVGGDCGEGSAELVWFGGGRDGRDVKVGFVGETEFR